VTKFRLLLIVYFWHLEQKLSADELLEKLIGGLSSSFDKSVSVIGLITNCRGVNFSNINNF
ncbi:MAG: hypothetical protein AAGJ18_31000, partial [Bacteroidota bacterium]